jgi:Na+/H+-dicarboxylate symporter
MEYRILIAMVAGILLGSLLNLLLHSAGVPESLRALLNDYLVGGLFDVVGRIFVASLKLLVVPLVLVSLICGSSSHPTRISWHRRRHHWAMCWWISFPLIR